MSLHPSNKRHKRKNPSKSEPHEAQDPDDCLGFMQWPCLSQRHCNERVGGYKYKYETRAYEFARSPPHGRVQFLVCGIRSYSRRPCTMTKRWLMPQEFRLADMSAPPAALGGDFIRRASSSRVEIWLWSLAALVFLMVIAGGATRLTESGLSITEWQPLTGVVPPLNEVMWRAEFENYKKIPQYAELFPGMDLSGFKFIYFFEWGHRLLGRMTGLAMALPLVFFWIRRELPPRFKSKLLGILALGGLQGAVGWWMVKSGLSDRVEVAQERLAIHLLLASLTFAALVWLASSLRPSREKLREHVRKALRGFSAVILLLLFVQIGLGALVAGLRAGRAFNTWPLIDGYFWPPFEKLTLLSPIWWNALDNLLLVQFQHRMLAYALFALAIAQALAALWYAPGSGAARRARLVAILVTGQAAFGVIALIFIVPLWAGLLHQAFAMVVLAAAVISTQKLAKPAISA